MGQTSPRFVRRANLLNNVVGLSLLDGDDNVCVFFPNDTRWRRRQPFFTFQNKEGKIDGPSTHFLL